MIFNIFIQTCTKSKTKDIHYPPIKKIHTPRKPKQTVPKDPQTDPPDLYANKKGSSCSSK
jgi:hypothetical protein